MILINGAITEVILATRNAPIVLGQEKEKSEKMKVGSKKELESLLKTVAIFYGTDLKTIRGDSREQPYPEARKVFVFLSKEYDIELVSSVLQREWRYVYQNKRRMDQEIKDDPELRYRIETIKSLIEINCERDEKDQNENITTGKV